MASITKTPEFILNDTELAQLGKATANVSRHFPSILTPKQQDIGVMLQTIGVIAFAKFQARNERIKKERKAVAPPSDTNELPNVNVFNLRDHPPSL